MAFNRNHRFYWAFTDADGANWKLYFTPSDVTDLSSPTEHQMPKKMLGDEIIISGGFADEVPYGMELAGTMKLKIPLHEYTAHGSDDYETVRGYIQEGFNPSTKTVHSREIAIPNIWELYNVDETKTYWTGVQTILPLKNYSINYISDTIWLDIEVVSIHQYILENTLIEDIDVQYNTIPYQSNIANFYVTIGSFYPTTIMMLPPKEPKSWAGTFAPITIVIESIATAIEEVLQAVKRDNTLTFTLESPELSKTYFESNHDRYYTYNPIETFTIYCLTRIVVKNEPVGGLFGTNSEHSLHEYNNCWNLLQAWCEGCLVKARYNHHTPGLYVTKILDPTSLRSTADRTISTSDIVQRTLDIEVGYGFCANSNVHVTNINEGTGEYEYTSKNHSLSNDSAEVGLVLHNQIPGYNHTPGTIQRGDNYYQRLTLDAPIARAIYRYNVLSDEISFVAVSDYLELSLGGNDYFGDDYIIAPVNVDGDDNYYAQYPVSSGYGVGGGATGAGIGGWVEWRMSRSGAGHVTAKALDAIHGSTDAGLIALTTAASIANNRYIGDIYIINVVLPDESNNTAIMVSYEYNVTTARTECKYYLPSKNFSS